MVTSFVKNTKKTSFKRKGKKEKSIKKTGEKFFFALNENNICMKNEFINCPKPLFNNCTTDLF